MTTEMNRPRRWRLTHAALGCGLIILTGCVSAEERYQRDVAKCESYGFSTESPDAFASCMQNEAQNRANRINATLNSIQPPPAVPPVEFHGPDLSGPLRQQASPFVVHP